MKIRKFAFNDHQMSIYYRWRKHLNYSKNFELHPKDKTPFNPKIRLFEFGVPIQLRLHRFQSILTLHFILLALLISFTSFNLAQAQETAPEVKQLRLALAGDDANEKRKTLRAISEPDIGTDDQVIPLLILAIDDRQGGESAVNALILRTGQMPVSGEWKNNMRTTKLAWLNWFQKWKQGQRIKNLEESSEKETQVEASKPVQTPVKQDAAVNRMITIPKDDLGKFNRILFKSGGSLVCVIKERNVDGDGNLLNVRIVHADGTGEEIIDRTLIRRIDDVNN